MLTWGGEKDRAAIWFGTNSEGEKAVSWGNRPEDRSQARNQHVFRRFAGKDEDEGDDNMLPRNASMAYFWKRVCVTYDGSKFKYYVDGRLENEAEMAFSVAGGGKLVIGSTADFDEVILKELRVFSKALSECCSTQIAMPVPHLSP